ncbi:hypothetical protein V8F20_003847 [Naviculisporaceae sp. PSN 640]
MATRGVSVLKFVGTVSLGVLTGLSYTLSNLTIPTLLTLPSAEAASKAFDSLTTSAKKQVQLLGAVSGSAFALAFLLSPRNFRHPYLLYTSLLVVGSRFITSDRFAPYLNLGPATTSSGAAAAAAKEKEKEKNRKLAKERAARRRMEASYEVLGDVHSEGTSDGAEEELLEAEAAAVEAGGVNGEEVREKVAAFLKKQVVHTVVSGVGFALAVVGIWGDGVVPVYGQTVVIKA